MSESTATPQVNYDDLARNSNPLPISVAVWIGRKPDDIVSGIQYEDVTKLTTEALLNKEMVVCGYSMRDGKKGPFAVVCCVPKDLGTVAVFTIGGEVVLRKLKEAGEAKAFPCRCHLTKGKGAKSGMSFYDLVSEVAAK